MPDPCLKLPDLVQSALVEHEIVPLKSCLNSLGWKISARSWSPPSPHGNPVHDFRTRDQSRRPFRLVRRLRFEEDDTPSRKPVILFEQPHHLQPVRDRLSACQEKQRFTCRKECAGLPPTRPPIRGWFPADCSSLEIASSNICGCNSAANATAVASDSIRVISGRSSDAPSLAVGKSRRTSARGDTSLAFSNSLTRCRTSLASCESISSSQNVDVCSLNETQSASRRGSLIVSYLTIDPTLIQAGCCRNRAHGRHEGGIMRPINS